MIDIRGLISSTVANRNFTEVAAKVRELGTAAITKNGKPVFVIMTYEEYLDSREDLPQGKFMNAARSDQGVWVILSDVIANIFRRNETTKSERRHPARFRILQSEDVEKVEILEIIDDTPRKYTFLMDRVKVTYQDNKVTVHTYGKPAWAMKVQQEMKGLSREEYPDALYSSSGLSMEDVRIALSGDLDEVNIIRYL